MSEKHKILVADDQTAVCHLLCALFGAEGWEVRAAPDGLAALSLAADWRPDLALVDMRMPGLDGLGVLAGLRQRYPGLPVLIMTALCDEAVVDEALAGGALAAVGKPFDVFQLRDRVAALLAGGNGDAS